MSIFLTRALAYILDLVMIGLCQFVASLALVAFAHVPAENFALGIGAICFLAYFTGCYWTTNGRTLGKRIFGLRVVGLKERLSLSSALLRALSYPVSYAVLAVGFLLPLYRKDARALHDMVSGTSVILTK